ncbi:unnamed protein product [Thlaspi arvense]|uniref:Uncharacterized protein n=1 Tax=Thlaspi arvense TaxID=13288 RepID=A0AAU9T3A3_THLAR|nr:unnamed protein product [Thlaspi arvense]
MAIAVTVAATVETVAQAEQGATIVAIPVTLLGIAFRNQVETLVVNVEVQEEKGATLAVTPVTLLGIAFRNWVETSEAAVTVGVALERAIHAAELVTWPEIVRLRDSLVLVTSVVVLVTWLVIVTGEEAVEAVETPVEVAASATSAAKEVTLQENALLLDCFPNQQTKGWKTNSKDQLLDTDKVPCGSCLKQNLVDELPALYSHGQLD